MVGRDAGQFGGDVGRDTGRGSGRIGSARGLPSPGLDRGSALERGRGRGIDFGQISLDPRL